MTTSQKRLFLIIKCIKELYCGLEMQKL